MIRLLLASYHTDSIPCGKETCASPHKACVYVTSTNSFWPTGAGNSMESPPYSDRLPVAWGAKAARINSVWQQALAEDSGSCHATRGPLNSSY